MINLTSDYKIMIDFKECICDTDSFVMTNIFNMISNKINLPFTKLVPLINDIEPSQLPLVKTNVNPLIEYINADQIDKADDIYNNILYHNYDSDNYLDFTSLANAIKPLLTNSNLHMIYIYVHDGSNDCSSILKLLNLFFNSAKVSMIVGNKKDFIDKFPCNCYIFQDANDITLINPTNSIDVIVPNHEYNLEIVKTINTEKINIYTGTLNL